MRRVVSWFPIFTIDQELGEGKRWRPTSRGPESS